MKRILLLLIILGTNVLALNIEDYKKLSALEMTNMVKKGEITSEELVKLSFEVIKNENIKLNALITTNEEGALLEARKIDINSNKPFLGVPIVMKGLGRFHQVKGFESTDGLYVMKDTLASEDGIETKKLKELGFIVVGQSNYPEFGMRNITTSYLYGAARNPYDLSKNAGGSSGGSASSISSGMVPVASGSDMGGSIRIPSSWNGLVGLKPTNGAMFSDSKDSLAVTFPLVKTVSDAIVLFENLKSKDYKEAKLKESKTIAYTLKSPMGKGTEPTEEAKKAVLKAVKFLKEKGYKLVEVDNPINGEELISFYTVQMLGVGQYLASIDDKYIFSKDNMDPLDYALYKLAKKYPEEIKQSIKSAKKDKMIEAFNKFHEKYTYFISPTTSDTAMPIPDTDNIYSEVVSEKMYNKLINIDKFEYSEAINILIEQWGPMLKYTPFNFINNITGEPAISLPIHMSKKGLPIGVMINAPRNYDMHLLELSNEFEKYNMFER